MHKDSHTKPLHDATAQMAVDAQMQWHKWLTTCTGATPKARTLCLLAKSYKQGRLCQLSQAVARCNGTNGCRYTDAVAQMADDLYGGYAPATLFL